MLDWIKGASPFGFINYRANQEGKLPQTNQSKEQIPFSLQAAQNPIQRLPSPNPEKS